VRKKENEALHLPSFQKEGSRGFNFVIYNRTVRMKRNAESLEKSLLSQDTA
jgi:hypothetical protein